MRNLELKFRCFDLSAVERRARNMGARDVGMLRQRDTFFEAPHARLKLRELGDGTGELISYVRSDSTGARPSEYHIAPVLDVPGLRRAPSGTPSVEWA